MSFQGAIAAKRDPVAAAHAVHPAQPYATLVLNGTFDDQSANEVLRQVAELRAAGTDSIVIEMQDVRLDDFARLSRFAQEIMVMRSGGVNVQIAISDSGLHELMRSLPDARDWLLSTPDAAPTGARRGIHVDQP